MSMLLEGAGSDTDRPAHDGLVLVIADPGDADAAALAGRLGPKAVLVTPRALSVPGWNWVPDPAARTGTDGVTRFRGDRLTAVVTRLASVASYQLGHVVPADRDYVAAEMTAFLRAWLADLPCPVLNPPRSLCLNGPAWNAEHWAAVAARLGIAVSPLHRRVGGGPSPEELAAPAPSARVTVVGADAVDHDGCAPVLVRHARTLAEAAATPLLAVDFDDTAPTGRLRGATCWPDLGDPRVLDALIDTLRIDTLRIEDMRIEDMPHVEGTPRIERVPGGRP